MAERPRVTDTRTDGQNYDSQCRASMRCMRRVVITTRQRSMVPQTGQSINNGLAKCVNS